MTEPEVLAAVASGEREALDAALAAGGDPNQRGTGGEPVLSHAAWRGDAAMAAALIDAGAAVDGTSDCGNAALMHAAACGHLEVLRLLLDRGADPAHRNKWELTAEDWAQWPDNAAEILAELEARSG